MTFTMLAACAWTPRTPAPYEPVAERNQDITGELRNVAATRLLRLRLATVSDAKDTRHRQWMMDHHFSANNSSKRHVLHAGQVHTIVARSICRARANACWRPRADRVATGAAAAATVNALLVPRAVECPRSDRRHSLCTREDVGW